MAKLLLKSGIVVTQDPRLGVLPTGDVLVENDRISAVAPTLPVTDAETVDCRGHFVLPGLVNAHMHTWQTALRSVAANWTLLEYFRHVHAGLATVFVPDDIQIATLAGALNQLDHGVTTLVDPNLFHIEANGIPTGVCGEAAADPALACVLVGLGVNTLSMVLTIP